MRTVTDMDMLEHHHCPEHGLVASYDRFEEAVFHAPQGCPRTNDAGELCRLPVSFTSSPPER